MGASKKSLMLLALAAGLALAGCGEGPAPEKKQESAAAPEPAIAAPALNPPDDADRQNIFEGETRPDSEADEYPIVATVNGAGLKRQLYESQLALISAEQMTFGLAEDDNGPQADLMRLEALNSMISLELACQEALRRGYAPAESEVEAALDDMKKSYEDQKTDLFKELERFGGSEDELKAMIVKNLALRKWQDYDFLAQVAVTDEEARAFYDQRRQIIANHGEMRKVNSIYLSVPLVAADDLKDKIRKKAETIHQRLKNGDNFGALAMEYSNSPDVTENYGKMGWLERGQMLSVYDKVIFSLKPGEISEPVTGPTGIYIFKLDDIRPAGVKTYNEMRVQIMDLLSREKLKIAMANKMADLYNQATIDIIDPVLKKAFDDYEAGLNQQAAPAADGE